MLWIRGPFRYLLDLGLLRNPPCVQRSYVTEANGMAPIPQAPCEYDKEYTHLMQNEKSHVDLSHRAGVDYGIATVQIFASAAAVIKDAQAHTSGTAESRLLICHSHIILLISSFGHLYVVPVLTLTKDLTVTHNLPLPNPAPSPQLPATRLHLDCIHVPAFFTFLSYFICRNLQALGTYVWNGRRKSHATLPVHTRLTSPKSHFSSWFTCSSID